VVAARLTSGRPGRVIPRSKNIYSVSITFLSSVTVKVVERHRKSPCGELLITPFHKLASNLVTIIGGSTFHKSTFLKNTDFAYTIISVYLFGLLLSQRH
jgi:hypothetical protein